MAFEVQFPDPREAEDDGLVAVGGAINPEFLIAAYRKGLFPWYNPGEPILWWSPNPRMILIPRDCKCSKSLRQKLNGQKFEVRFDRAFSRVIHACAKTERRGQKGTWITPEIVSGYTELHRMGIAHSVETYLNDELVGGLYGVSLGTAFFGESMFYTVRDASKVALYYLCKQLDAWNFEFVDVQQSTGHLKSMGARDVTRDEFLERLEKALKFPGREGVWSLEVQ